LIVGPERVLCIDFKSNALVPETPDAVPEGLKRQMGAYARALSLIYPDRRIDTAILWTRGPVLMALHGIVCQTPDGKYYLKDRNTPDTMPRK